MAEVYRYTQIGTVTIIMILLAAAFTFYMIAPAAGSMPQPILIIVGLVVGILIIFTLAAFYSFTIQIVDGMLNFWFGFGVGKKSISINEIRSIDIVKTPWYFFWGIKSIPGGWLYSIAPGGEALELVFMDNKKIQLGTNRPAEIKESIETVMCTVT